LACGFLRRDVQIEVVTLFPELVRESVKFGVLGRAIERGIVRLGCEDPRTHTRDVHRTVDDRPYGGGPGMVLRAEPVVDCVESVQAGLAPPNPAEPDAAWRTLGHQSNAELNNEIREPDQAPEKGHLIMLTPQGRRLTQRVVEELATKRRLVLLCGRYEGFDDRVRQLLVPDEISIGDYVLGGGEVAAMVVVDSVIRLIPGVLGHERSAVEDSFSDEDRWLEGPQFTRPREYRGLTVPEVLLGGNHAEIAAWRKQESLEKTRTRRADLLDGKE
jgi:tRNA (guanine37-N1)-methyltransferase